VFINGTNTFVDNAGGVITVPGGILAAPDDGNIGTYQRNAIAWVPEVNANLIYHINPCWQVMAGYSFVYWSNVVLAGNQIEQFQGMPRASVPHVPGAPPHFQFTRSDFWAQGLSTGIQYSW
jgi:hypothetical protein